MKLLSYFRLRWLIPCLLAIVGFTLYFATSEYTYIGLFLVAVGAVICCFNLLQILQIKHCALAKKLRFVFCILLIIFVLMYALTFAMIARASFGDTQADCAYVLVLGAKVNGTQPSQALDTRINQAYRYLTEHPEAIAIVSGGLGKDEQISEAQCMFDALTKMGIAPERILMEDRATSTKENFSYSLELLEQADGTKPRQICVISSEFHLLRTKYVAKQYGVEAIVIPARTQSPILLFNNCLREVIALWYYLLV